MTCDHKNSWVKEQRVVKRRDGNKLVTTYFCKKCLLTISGKDKKLTEFMRAEYGV